MMKLPYWHVDAFADRPFKGNQAAVMPLEEWLPDDVLQAIGEENNFAETAFVVPDDTGEADYQLRWFTPTDEVRMCGHATLASGHAILARDGGERVSFLTRQVGILEVVRTEAGYEVGLPAISTEPGEWAEAVELIGAKPLEIRLSPDRYGIYLFDSEETVRGLDPDIRGLGELGNHMFVCTARSNREARDKGGPDVVSRVFVPGGGVDEDSVTGAAHAALTPFWTSRLGCNQFSAHQASQRGGDLVCRQDGDRAWLGGPCFTVVEGSFYLSG